MVADRWLAAEKAAEYLGVGKDAAYSWVSAKGMPGHRIGRFWNFKRDEGDAWMRAGGASADSDPGTTHGTEPRLDRRC